MSRYCTSVIYLIIPRKEKLRYICFFVSALGAGMTIESSNRFLTLFRADSSLSIVRIV